MDRTNIPNVLSVHVDRSSPTQLGGKYASKRENRNLASKLETEPDFAQDFNAVWQVEWTGGRRHAVSAGGWHHKDYTYPTNTKQLLGSFN